MNTHEQIKELLTDYALSELPEQKSTEIKQHLADCQECRTELKKLEAVLECAESMSKFPADEQLCQSAKESLLEAVADEEKKEPMSRPTIRLDLIWSTIMKSRITKLAAAAVIIIAALIGIIQITSSGLAIADVIDKVEGAHAFMYKMKMKMTGSMMPGAPPANQDMQSTVIISNDFGMKMEMNMTDPNTGIKMNQQMYILPHQKVMFIVMPDQKKYIRMELTDDLLDKMKKENNDPREMIRRMAGTEYTKLGRSVIDGVVVEGFETTDPAFLGGMLGDVKVTMWVNSATSLPVLIEMLSQRTSSRSYRRISSHSRPAV
jgi:hypothetical protein